MSNSTKVLKPGASYFQFAEYDPVAEARRLDRQAALTGDRELDLLRRHGLGDGRDVVDFGAGTGSFTRMLRAAFPDQSVLALDVNPHALRCAEPPRVVSTAGKDVPLSSSSVDNVVMRFVVQHLTPEMRQQVFADSARILRPGGTLHIIDVDDRDAGKLSPMPMPIVRSYAAVSAYQRECGGSRHVMAGVPDELGDAGFASVVADGCSVDSTHVPLEDFDVHFGPARFAPYVDRGVLTSAELLQHAASWAGLLAHKHAYAIVKLHALHACLPAQEGARP